MTMRFLLLNSLDEDFLKDLLTEVLEPMGNLSVASAAEGMPAGMEEPDGLIIIDASSVDRVDQLITRLRLESQERRIVVLTASPTWHRARAAFEAGAMDYLPKSFKVEELREAFLRALRNPLPR